MIKYNTVVIGASGGIGQALVNLLAEEPDNQVFACSRQTPAFDQANVICMNMDITDESSIVNASQSLRESGVIQNVFVASGFLHDDTSKPEKSLKQLNKDNFLKNLELNTIGPALVAKHMLPLMDKTSVSRFAILSARVGSISDNRLGGWYSYRASKAALNMFIKTASIEHQRSHKYGVLVGLHPGTVNTGLSRPFQANVPEGKLFTPEFSAAQLIRTTSMLNPPDTGKIFAWDGKEIPS